MATPASQPSKESQAEPQPSISMEDSGFDLVEELEEKNPKFLTQGRLVAFRAALLTFLIQEGLPKNQRWIYYTLMLYYRQDFVNLVYTLSYGAISLLWYCPTTSPFIAYKVAVVVDGFKRFKYINFYETCKSSIISALDYDLIFWILYSTIGIEVDIGIGIGDLTPLLESVLGSADFWPRAIIPILPWLLYTGERSYINGFVPEGKQGIIMAIFVWACTAVLPLSVQWVLWLFYAIPDPHYPVMAVEWFLCTLAWQWFGTPPQVAYCLHLFVNQFPHPESWFPTAAADHQPSWKESDVAASGSLRRASF